MTVERSPSFRVLSLLLVLIGIVQIAFTGPEFVFMPSWVTGMALALTILLFAAYLGLRRMRKWSVYLFFACYGAFLILVLIGGAREFLSNPGRAFFALLPAALFLGAWLPNRFEFK